MDITTHRQALRSSMRQKRALLTKRQTISAGQSVARILKHKIPHHHSVGLYLSAYGEVSTQPIIAMLWHRGCQVWLPVINPYNRTLYWRKYTPQLASSWRKHRHPLGMYQSHTGSRCSTAMLDTLLVPLLAIDRQGNRLGQGGGFYDRTLAKLPRYAKRPHSIGIAYCGQVLDEIPVEPWDKPLQAFCTPRGYHNTATKQQR
jgi:5-formyltetrahydrofolate cyclo-ligase